MGRGIGAVAVAAFVIGFGALRLAEPDTSAFAPLETPDTELLQSGDLIFREGTSLMSSAVQVADEGGRFTHVGILSRDGGEAYVIHVEPGKDLTRIEAVKREPLGSYLAEARSWSVLRHNDLEDNPRLGRRIATASSAYVRSATKFDRAMDLSSDHELYCTELVWRTYGEALKQDLTLEIAKLSTPLGDMSIILPSAFFKAPGFTEILNSHS